MMGIKLGPRQQFTGTNGKRYKLVSKERAYMFIAISDEIGIGMEEFVSLWINEEKRRAEQTLRALGLGEDGSIPS